MLFSTACRDLALVGNFTGSCRQHFAHTATAQHPRAPFHKALLSSLTRTAPSQPSSSIPAGSVGKTSLCKWSPREVFPPGTSRPQLKKTLCSEGSSGGDTEGHSPVFLLGLRGTQAGRRTSGPAKLKPWAPELEPVPRDTEHAT